MKNQITLLSLLPIWMGLNNVDAFAPISPALSVRTSSSSSTVATTSDPLIRPISTETATPSSSRSVLFMGWGPEPIWTPAKVKSKTNACNSGRSVLFTVDVSPETAAEYKVPGASLWSTGFWDAAHGGLLVDLFENNNHSQLTHCCNFFRTIRSASTEWWHETAFSRYCVGPWCRKSFFWVSRQEDRG